MMFLYEVSTEWYERYQRLLDLADDSAGITIDEPDQDDERLDRALDSPHTRTVRMCRTAHCIDFDLAALARRTAELAASSSRDCWRCAASPPPSRRNIS